MKTNKLTLKDNILREFFNVSPDKYKNNDSSENKLAEKLNVSINDLKATLDFLFNLQLIRKIQGSNYKENRTFDWEITPEGLHYLEKRNSEDRQEKINLHSLKATIIIAIATALNVLITIFIFILDLEKSNWAKPVSLAVFGILIACLSGILIKEIGYFLFPKNEN